MTSTRNIAVRSWKWILQAAALLALAVVIPACGGGGGGGVIIPPFTITTTSLPNGTVATVYPNQTLTTVSGTAPIAWALVNGTALPAGMALAPATGVISGTPTGPSSGITSFMLRATDAKGLTADRVLSIAVTGGAPAALTVTSAATLPAGTQN